MNRWSLFSLPLFSTAGVALLWLAAGCNDKSVPPTKPVQIVNGESYFPMHDGDIWYYNSGNFIYQVDGDTTIDGVVCKRVLKGGETDQAWTVNSQRFAVHLLEGFMWLEPPLDIPLNLVKSEPHQFSSRGLVAEGFVSDADSFRMSGTLTFGGYVKRTINLVELDSCIQLDYVSKTRIYFKNGTTLDDDAAYSEYYARGIGLIYNGDIGLDEAIINGVHLPTAGP